MNLKKIVKLLTSKFVGTGPSSYKKRIYRAAVWQNLGNTALEYYFEIRRWNFFSKRLKGKSKAVPLQAWTLLILPYTSVSQPLWDRGPVNSFFIRRGPGPDKFTRKYLSNFFKFIH